MGRLLFEVVPVTPLQQNCTLFWDEDERRALVVDPGGDAPTIVQRLEALGLTADRILITHGHVDHAGGAAELRDLLGTLSVEGPGRQDAFLLEGLALQGQRFGLPARAIEPDRWLEEGDAIALGPHRFDVLHVPGHAPGHVVFVERTQRIAQIGDTLFRGSIGRTDLPGGHHATLLDAIRTKLLPLGDDMRFICGHGPGSTIGVERRTNPFLLA